jgi:hypothetical protein
VHPLNTNIRVILLVFSLILFALTCPFPAHPSSPEELPPLKSLHTGQVTVHFAENLATAAQNLIDIYPSVKTDLEGTFGWKFDFLPRVVLLRHTSIVAIAQPEENLVVIDYPKMGPRSTRFSSVLKHELCHLLLHRNIRDLPRWLDEGVCQWVSDDLAEVIAEHRGSTLDEALLSGLPLGFIDLAHYFQGDGRSVILAYEASRSYVDYLEGSFGRDRFLKVLTAMKEGSSFGAALRERLNITPDALEKDWYAYMKPRRVWIYYLSIYLYEILFFCAALVTFLGFLRILRRRKTRAEENDDDQGAGITS